jgi:hypothetical protein
MYIKKTKGPRSVRLPDGTLMSLAHGLIDTQEALKAYHLSEEEFMSWVRAIADHGEDALKTTSTQKYRQP